MEVPYLLPHSVELEPLRGTLGQLAVEGVPHAAFWDVETSWLVLEGTKI